MLSVYQAFSHSVGKYTEKPFLHIPAVAAKSYQDSATDLTYRQAGKATEQIKTRYQEAGYGIGHRVALLLDNRKEFFLHWFALNGLGVSVVPVNGEMSTEEKAYLLAHSDVCLAVSIPEQFQALNEAAQYAGINLAVVDAEPDKLPSAPSAAQTGEPDEHTECALLYTSGSTGKPKGCILTNDYFILSGRAYVELGGLCALEEGKERLLTPLPLVHMNAMAASTMAMVMTGGCLIQLDRFHPRIWWKTVTQSKATVIHYLGVMPAILLSLDKTEEETAHQVKFGFGAGVNPTHHEPFETRFGIPLIEAWGMTESGNANSIVACHEPRHVGTSCIGKPPESIEVKLVDVAGQEVPCGKPGELLVRAVGDNPRKGFFREYLKNPQATAEAWEGNWLHTGDVLRFGEDGQLHFVDRRKNIIRRSGENISALEVEAVLSLHPAIEQVAVAPVPDEIRGDEVMACIILKPTAMPDQATAQSIFDHCYDALTYYKVPGYIAFVEEMPLTASHKPQRGEIKTLCRNLVGAERCFDLRGQKKKQR